MAYRIGIDAGSKTIKVVVTSEDGTLVHAIYRRHRADIRTTLAEALHDLVWRHGDIEGTVGITGSAGIGLASMLGLPFVQEVVATTRAVQAAYPQADAIIELGGEDAKVVYLTGGLEQRMNATCAGGTGGFIDTIAFMLGSSSKNMNALALGANRIYPIASRCAVFAQTDVRPLLNAGARTSDIAASALEAVVRQTLGGLACGRPIAGTVIFLGGPLEHIPELVRRFRTALGISRKEGIKPANAHLFTAQGAAMIAAEEWHARDAGAAEGGEDATKLAAREGAASSHAGTGRTSVPATCASATMGARTGALVSIAQLEERLAAMPNPENDLVRLPPLFASEDELAAFRQRHDGERTKRARLFDCAGPLYMGVDAGSTAVKVAAIDDEGRLAYSDYRPTKGDALATATDMLLDFYRALPHAVNGVPYAYVAHATVTGYGEELLKAGLGIDSGVVETMAHLRAAQSFRPDVTFLLDIGGQDMKAIWVRDGRVTNAVLNEACSSGCGSFIEGTAYSLRSTPYRFATEALAAHEPVDLGTKCTVFMTSRVRHAQKIGVPLNDIAAGIAYSVVKNALFRIIGINRMDSLGPCVVVQGGAFKSDAVLRAFELVSGVEAIRPDTAHLMGALGAALTARERARAGGGKVDEAGKVVEGSADFLQDATDEQGKRLAAAAGMPARNVAQDTPADSAARSTLLDADALAALAPKRSAMRCPGCTNACALSLVEFPGGRRFVSGNRCDRAEDHVARLLGEREGERKAKARDARQDKARTTRAGQGEAQASNDESGPVQAPAGEKDRAPLSGGENAKGGRHGQHRPPNVMALEQKLLAAFGDETSCDLRGHLRVGVLVALNAYEQLPFWHTLFATLGFSLVVADDQRAQEQGSARQGAATIPSESVCYPAKLAHQRLYDLANAGADVAFMPRYQRENHCPVTSTYADALADSAPIVRDGTCPLASPTLSSPKLPALCASASDRATLRDCINDLSTRGNAPAISEDEFNRAMARARAAQDAFEGTLRHGNERALQWVHGRAGRRGIIVAGRPYHADPAVLHGIDRVLEKLGFAVLSPLGMGVRSAATGNGEREADAANSVDSNGRSGGNGGSAPHGDAACADWKQAKHFVRLARRVIQDPALEVVFLQSFGCGFDAVNLDVTRRMLERAGRPFTTLKVDDIVDTAHIRIRLRTLAEALEADAWSKRPATQGAALESASGLSPAPATPCIDAAANAARGTSEAIVPTASTPGDSPAAPPLPLALLGSIEQTDVEMAQQAVSSDVCFVVAALAGRAIRLVEANPALRAIEAPAFCEHCLLDALPALVESATGSTVGIEWTGPWPAGTGGQQDSAPLRKDAEGWQDESPAESPVPPPPDDGMPAAGAIALQDGLPHREACDTASRKPRIGVIGCALLCFDPFMNDGLAGFIESQGCEAVLPDPARLFADDVRYLDQLDLFAAQGVNHVIYLQSFGCLKGHVQARGALHQLARRYPTMPITVIDYDPEASALNRENRIRLALAAAKAANASQEQAERF